MYEAGCFAGFEIRQNRYGQHTHSGGPFGTMASAFGLLTLTVEITTKIFLILRTITSSSTSGIMSPSSLFLILLSVIPSILPFLRRPGQGVKRRQAWRKNRREEGELKEMARRGEYKQELVLFGLADWLLDRWDAVTRIRIREQEEAREQMGLTSLGLGLSGHGIETIFYVSLSLSHPSPLIG